MEAGSNEKTSYRWATLLAFAGFILGAAVGWTKGVHALQSLAEALAKKGERFCGTGIVSLPFFLAFVLAIVGAVPGIAVAVRVYLKSTRRPPPLKSDWETYYGK